MHISAAFIMAEFAEIKKITKRKRDRRFTSWSFANLFKKKKKKRIARACNLKENTGTRVRDKVKI